MRHACRRANRPLAQTADRVRRVALLLSNAVVAFYLRALDGAEIATKRPHQTFAEPRSAAHAIAMMNAQPDKHETSPKHQATVSRTRRHSCRRASMGSTRDARLAGT